MDLATRHRSRNVVLQLGRRERGDRSFLIGADLVRECAGVDMKDGNLLRFVDGVRAVVSDRFYIQAPEFLEIRLRINGHDFRIVGTRHQERTGTCDHEKKMSVRVEDVDTLRIGAKLLHVAAIWAHLIR